jgi:thioredoxin-like negative regulator of GroEL
MLDSDGSSGISFQEFMSAAKECMVATQQLASNNAIATDVLQKVSRRLAADPATAQRAWEAADAQRKGWLEPNEAAAALRRLCGLVPAEMRILMSHLRRWGAGW